MAQLHPKWKRYLLTLGYWAVLEALAWLGCVAFPVPWLDFLPAAVLAVGGLWMLFVRWDLPGDASRFLQRGISLLLLAAAGWMILPAPFETRLPWQDCTDLAMAQAKKDRRPALIYFTADGCLLCRRMDHRVFFRQDVAAAAQGFAALKADMTYPNAPLARAVADLFNITAYPTVVFLGADGQERSDLRLLGFEDAPAFIRRLRSLSGKL